jgi:acetyl/propionyl-CoA carboxylase alpha subunit
VFDIVLVADRGASAVHVIRECERLGIKAVSVHSDADAGAPHAVEADESVLLGEESSYVDHVKLVEAARQTGAQAVHPGAGPLAESAAFAQAVRDAGLTWVGPSTGSDVEQQLRNAAREHDEVRTRGDR